MQNLLDQLRARVREGITGHEEHFRALLADYVTSGLEDWHQYRLFAPYKYARNLVDITMDLECIVICWDDNQESPIHNHNSQHCWFAVLEGCVEEVRYVYDQTSGVITEGTKDVLTNGHVCYIRDEIALHKVRSVGGKSCTLHIYSKPIPFCNIYDPVSGEVSRRNSGFYSVRGLKQCSEGTAAYLEIYRQLTEELLQQNPSVETKT